MTPDEKIAAFLGEARPAVVEPAFDAAVMERVARRELARSLALGAGAALVGGLVLWAVAPVLATAVEPMARTLLTGAGFLIATLSLVGLGERALRRA